MGNSGYVSLHRAERVRKWISPRDSHLILKCSVDKHGRALDLGKAEVNGICGHALVLATKVFEVAHSQVISKQVGLPGRKSFKRGLSAQLPDASEATNPLFGV